MQIKNNAIVLLCTALIAGCNTSGSTSASATNDRVFEAFALPDGSIYNPGLIPSTKPSAETCSNISTEQVRIDSITGTTDTEIEAFSDAGPQAIRMLQYRAAVAETAVFCLV